MGRRDKLRLDPSLAFDHPAGSKIEVMQPLAHARLGALGYIWPRHWVGHLDRADAAHAKLVELHERLEEVPLGAGNRRLLPVDEFLFEMYGVGTEMVVQSVLTVQHFAEEVERATVPNLDPGPVTDRLRAAADAAGLVSPDTLSGWDGFVEIVKIRDAIEHPKPGNTYNARDGEWDRVPLAWMLSERPVAAYARFSTLIDTMATEWEAGAEARKKPGTLTVSKRGLRSDLPAKKQRPPG